MEKMRVENASDNEIQRSKQEMQRKIKERRI
jgi:hypothetical protein